jgi:hypothetical protein
MKRRRFLAMFAALPFVGKLFPQPEPIKLTFYPRKWRPVWEVFPDGLEGYFRQAGSLAQYEEADLVRLIEKLAAECKRQDRD